ncbi:hypothetical protein ACFU5P_30960 [Streptomyces sp. NPDC057433]|uniref:hypothetical protein n=1 Tax=Streptomyces sp. NPDC057433 TaxID=3346132 RepID=UPI00368ED550
MTAVADAATTAPERHYTHHDGRGATPHRSNQAVIHRTERSSPTAPTPRPSPSCATG